MADEGKKKKIHVHTSFTCSGGPLHGTSVRVYPDNPREVRLQTAAPVFSPIPMTDGSYHLEGGKLRWVVNPNERH